MEAHIERILARDNPWLAGRPLEPWLARRLPEGFVPRQRRLALESGQAELVVGPRQAGKSTLAWWSLQARGGPVLLLDCEEHALRSWLRSPALFFDDLAALAEPLPALLLEEAQHLAEAGLFVKGLVDRGYPAPIVVTGSSSFHLEARTRESLAGRARRTLLLPFSLGELSVGLPSAPLLRQRTQRDLVERAARFGGFPAVVRSQAPEEELARLVEAFIVRDASDRFAIRHLDAFRRLLGLVAGQAGNLANHAEWAAHLGISADTVAEYMALLEETHVVRALRPFAGGRRAELIHRPKVYFVDNGIRNAVFGGFAPLAGRADAGALIENLVLSELLKAIPPLLVGMHHWRTRSGAEVDFVLEHRGRVLGVEVKAGDARGRLTRSARSFLEAYRPELFLVVHSGEPLERDEGGCRVRFLGVPDLADAVGGWLG
jgi:predicted AAA+ superfamily ATPase